MFEAMIDPAGTPTAAEQAVPLAPRPENLRGRTVGLLANSKKNAEEFLDSVGVLLSRDYGASGLVRRKKRDITNPVPAEILADLVGRCDVVVVGFGDCGSCSASAIADGLLLEAEGIPAVVVCTEAFRTTADAMAALRGSPGYRYVTTAHPVAVLDRDGVRERAGRVITEIVGTVTASALAA